MRHFYLFLLSILITHPVWSQSFAPDQANRALQSAYDEFNRGYCSPCSEDARREKVAIAIDRFLDFRKEYCSWEDSLAIWHNQGVVEALRGRWMDAEQEWKRVLSTESDPLTLYHLGLVAYLQGDLSACLGYWNGLEPDPLFPHLKYNREAVLFQTGIMPTPDTSFIFSNKLPSTQAYNESFWAEDPGPILSRARQLDAKNALAWQRTGWLQQTKKPTMAHRAFRKAARQSKSAVHQINAAMSFAATGRGKAAQRILENFPTSDFPAERKFVLGLVALQEQDSSRAAQLFHQALDEDPTLAEAQVALGQIALAEQEFYRALYHFQSAQMIKPQLPAAHLGKAIALYEAGYKGWGDLKEAISELEALENISLSKEMQYRRDVLLGFALLRSFQNEEQPGNAPQRAVVLLNRAHESFPLRLAPITGLGLAAWTRGDFRSALNWWKKGMRLAPNNSHLPLLAAAMLYDFKDYPNALTYYRKAHRLNPTEAKALNGIGNCLRELEQYPEAINAFSQAIQLSRADLKDEYFNNRAITLHEYGSYWEDRWVKNSQRQEWADSARYYYQQAIVDVDTSRTISGDDGYLLNKGTMVWDSTLGAKGNDTLAYELYVAGNISSYTQNNLGVVYAIRGEMKEARKHFRQSADNRPSDYLTPLFNLRKSGGNLTAEESGQVFGRTPQVSSFGSKGGYILTFFYHFHYPDRFRLPDALFVELPVVYQPAEPRVIIDFKWMACETQREDHYLPRDWHRVRDRTIELYTGNCPGF
jgi:tetratricopeptide (TPR) repeat protein